MKNPKEFESISGTIVQRQLFVDGPKLIFEGEEKDTDRHSYVDVANVSILLEKIETLIMMNFKTSDALSLKPLQESILKGFFQHFRNIVSKCPPSQDLGIEIVDFFNQMDSFVRITAWGVSDECYRDSIKFLKEGLETDNVSKKIEELLNTQNQMRGKKVTKERKGVYEYLEKEEKKALINRIPVTLEYLLRKYSNKNSRDWTDGEIHRIIGAFYQWRLRNIKKTKKTKKKN